MKNLTATKHYSYLTTKCKHFLTQSLSPKIVGVIREMEHWIGIRIVKVELTNLNEYSSTLSQRIGKTYHSHQKKRSYICVHSSASAFNCTHNEISANIEKHQAISQARWNDNLIEYICNH
jgi:hypothetical protein